MDFDTNSTNKNVDLTCELITFHVFASLVTVVFVKNMVVSESILNKFAFCYFILTCLGFLFHLQEISREYFLYRTVNRMEVHLDDLMPTPHLSLCFRYWDILPNDIQSQTDMDDLSLEEIFNKTPRVQETLKNCLVRDPETHLMLNSSKTSSECLEEELKIQKYFMQEHICYDFSTLRLKLYPLLKTAHSLWHANLIYQVELSEKLLQGKLFMPIVYIVPQEVDKSRFKYPLTSRNFGKYMNRVRNNKFAVYHSWEMIHLLPPPFESNCVYMSGKEECFRKCLIYKLSKRIKRLPYSEIIPEDHEEGVDLKLNPLSKTDLDSIDWIAYQAALKTSEDECNNKCTQRNCDHFYTLTTIYSEINETMNRSLLFKVMTPESPTLVNRLVPSLGITEFIIYICSCFGIWFGVGVLSFSPGKKKVLKIISNFISIKSKRRKQMHWRHTSHRQHISNPMHLTLSERLMGQ